VIKVGSETNGQGHSWTIPVYISNFKLVNVGSADEDDPPPLLGLNSRGLSSLEHEGTKRR
jgi:hypothetical protein